MEQIYEAEPMPWDEHQDKGRDADITAIAPIVPASLPQHSGMVQSHTPFVSAMQVIKPRDLVAVERAVLKHATLMGEAAMYGWGAGKGRVEGLTIRMAMIIFREMGNMTIVAEPVQETAEAWIFTHYLVDLERGASAPRQWRESKRSRVDGNLDPERKDAIRFQRGQSKNIRNVILANTPAWLVQKILVEAKKGARESLEKWIAQKGIAAAQSAIVKRLAHYGVTEEQILEKVAKAEIKGLDVDDLIMLSSDLRAIESGEEHVSALFPTKAAEANASLKDKLKSKLAKSPATDVPVLQVQLGAEPYSWQVTDREKIYLVSEDGTGQKTCSCKVDRCAHCAAVEAYIAGSPD